MLLDRRNVFEVNFSWAISMSVSIVAVLRIKGRSHIRCALLRGAGKTLVFLLAQHIAAVLPRPQDGTACFSHRTLHNSVRLCDRL